MIKQWIKNLIAKNKVYTPSMKEVVAEFNETDNNELIEWLKGNKYLIDEKSETATEEFEKKHQWELSRNMMINKTITYIQEGIRREK